MKRRPCGRAHKRPAALSDEIAGGRGTCVDLQRTSRSVHFETVSPSPFAQPASFFLRFLPRLPPVIYPSVKTSGRIAIADVMAVRVRDLAVRSFQSIAPDFAAIVKPVFQAIFAELEPGASFVLHQRDGFTGIRPAPTPCGPQKWQTITTTLTVTLEPISAWEFVSLASCIQFERLFKIQLRKKQAMWFPPQAILKTKSMLQGGLVRLTNCVLNADATDLGRALRRKARDETVGFVEEHMLQAKVFRNKWKLLEAALRCVTPDAGNLFCEFGVYRGDTINFISARTQNMVFGFDSFEGLPEDWFLDVEKGTFRLNRLPRVRKNVTLIKGWFNETLPRFACEHQENCCFLHIDADLYSSCKTIFDVLGNRIGKGTVIVFDEFFNYPGWRQGEFLAFREFVSARQLQFEYLGYVIVAEQVAIRIK